jgi:hypothetical protein
MYLDSCEHSVCLADKAHYNGTLLDRFRSIFDLEDTALRRESDGIVVVVVSEHDGGGNCGV